MNIKISEETINNITEQLAKGSRGRIRAGYLTGKIEDNTAFIDGVYIPEQVSDRVMTEISDETQAKSIQAIKENGKTLVGIVQYNGIYRAYESATTKEFRNKFAQTTGSPNIGIVLNSAGDYQIFK